MGNIGDLSTTTGSDMLGFRCPIGDSKVMEVSDVVAVIAGTMAIRSDCLILPLQSVTSGIYIGAYSIPRLRYSCLPASALIAGDKMYWDSSNSHFAVIGSDEEVKVTGVVTEAKAAGVSYVEIDFNGYGHEDSITASDALYLA